MKFCVSDDPGRLFDSADAALHFAMDRVYLRPVLFGTYVDRLNRGLAVTWGYGFTDVSVRPVKAAWAAPDPPQEHGGTPAASSAPTCDSGKKTASGC